MAPTTGRQADEGGLRRRIGRVVGWQAFEEGCVYATLGESHIGRGGESEVLYKTYHRFTLYMGFGLDVA